MFTGLLILSIVTPSGIKFSLSMAKNEFFSNVYFQQDPLPGTMN